MDTDEGSDGDDHEAGLLPAPAKQRKFDNGEPPQRMIKTVCLILLWISLGLVSSVGGTTVVDFSEILRENYGHIGFALAVHFVSVLIGLFVSGFLTDGLGWRRELLLGMSAIAISLANLVKPHSVHVVMYAMSLGVEGIFKGMAKPAANNLLLSLWRKKAPTPLNFFHFGYGVGTLVGPFLANPFLSKRCPSASLNATVDIPLVCQHETGDNEIKYIRESRITIPFTLSAIPMFVMGVLFLLFYFRERNDRLKKLDEFHMDVVSKQFKDGNRRIWGIIIVALLVCFYFTLAGAAFGGYLFTIAFESDLKCSKDDAAKMAATFNAAFTAGRLLCAIFLQWMSIKTIFIFYVFGSLASMTGLAMFGLESKTSLWLLSAVWALYAGPLWPSGLSWGNHYIHLSTINIAIIEAGACVGEILFFWLGGHLIDVGHISTIFIMTLSSTAVSCLVVVTLYIIAHRIGERKFTERNDLELEKFQ